MVSLLLPCLPPSCCHSTVKQQALQLLGPTNLSKLEQAKADLASAPAQGASKPKPFKPKGAQAGSKNYRPASQPARPAAVATTASPGDDDAAAVSPRSPTGVPEPKRYLGVSWDRTRWRADIKVNGRVKNLGTHETPEEAAQVRDAAALLLFGW